MQIHCILVLLVCGAFGVTTLAGFNPPLPPELEKFQLLIKKISMLTLQELKELQEKIDLRQKSMKEKLTFGTKIEWNEFKITDSVKLEKAKEEGKNRENIDICVKNAQAFLLNDLIKSHSKSVKCVQEATEIAKDKVKNAKKTFESRTSTLYSINDVDMNKCDVSVKECTKRKIAEYKYKFNLIKKLSEKTNAISREAYTEQFNVTYKCFEAIAVEIEKLQKKQHEIVTNCIINA